MREELVEMAVKFLLHPTVGRSPVSRRRSFLEKRGLTSDEIDEAFRRVPDATSSVPFRQDINSSQDVQSKSFARVSSQPLAEPMLTVSRPSRFSWSYAIVSIVLLIFSGAGTSMLLKKLFFPRLKSWIRKVVLEEDDDERRNSKQSLSKETIKAAKAVAVASVGTAKASLQMLQSNKEEGRRFDVLLRRLGIHIAELRSMRITVQGLESARNASYKHTDQFGQRTSQNGLDSNLSKTSVVHRDYPENFPSPMKFRTSGVLNFDSSVRPSSASPRPSSGQHPKSYMEITAKIQRGEKPPGIKDIDDSPPNPNQPLPNPQITPRLKPWEIAQQQNNLVYTPEKGFSQPNVENGQPWWRRGNGMRTYSYGPRTD
ncbi:PEROXISOME DEFECTIVE 2, peroxin 14 [Hibiscus trionum]|uniref:Peroxisomal membrane protein PEX14 n=1 Tax=Hibiscus trionum TaxID=183268 RepID=A0A9W7JG90_HIBTR|nr:PEROXISOME DEFECTIVE 2, peroxin 14 [Hibiscus trionum]